MCGGYTRVHNSFTQLHKSIRNGYARAHPQHTCAFRTHAQTPPIQRCDSHAVAQLKCTQTRTKQGLIGVFANTKKAHRAIPYANCAGSRQQWKLTRMQWICALFRIASHFLSMAMIERVLMTAYGQAHRGVKRQPTSVHCSRGASRIASHIAHRVWGNKSYILVHTVVDF